MRSGFISWVLPALAVAMLVAGCGPGKDDPPEDDRVCNNPGAGSDWVTLAGTTHMEGESGFVYSDGLICKPSMSGVRYVDSETTDWTLHVDYSASGLSFNDPSGGVLLNIRIEGDAIAFYNMGIQADYFPTPSVVCSVDLHTTGQDDAATAFIDYVGIPGQATTGSLHVTHWSNPVDPACPGVTFDVNWSVTREAEVH